MAGEGDFSAQKPIVINITAITTTPMVRSGTQDRRVFMGVLNFLFNPEVRRARPGWPEYSQFLTEDGREQLLDYSRPRKRRGTPLADFNLSTKKKMESAQAGKIFAQPFNL